MEKSLQPYQDPAERSVAAPLAALAEAMRANAEALRRMDASQRKMAESIERSDKAQQVVASTKALNETFRGLSEIQRGLLDAVVRTRGRAARSPGLVFLAVGGVAALLAVLIYAQWMDGRTVGRSVYEQARQRAEDLAARSRDLTAQLEGRDRDHRGRREAYERKRKELEGAKEELARKTAALEAELETKNARLENYLAVKAQADLAGGLQVRNMGLEREVRNLKERLDGLQQERKDLYGYLGDRLVDTKGGDPVAIKEMAKKLGIYKEPEPPVMPGGPIPLAGTAKRMVVRQLNRLFPDAEEAYDVIDVGKVEDGWRFQEVTLTRHKRGRLVNSFRCKELTIIVDVAQDTLEVRLQDGYMTNTGRPAEQIPLGAGGHSIFLPEAGIKAWLSRASHSFAIGEKGRLTWKSTPS
ncbi:MAG: hypothetical protein ACYTDU_06210 [Planctomycetota bacterium]